MLLPLPPSLLDGGVFGVGINGVVVDGMEEEDVLLPTVFLEGDDDDDDDDIINND